MDNATLNSVLQHLEDRQMKSIICFRHDWNNEVIAQFFSTLYFKAPNEEKGENMRG